MGNNIIYDEVITVFSVRNYKPSSPNMKNVIIQKQGTFTAPGIYRRKKLESSYLWNTLLDGKDMKIKKIRTLC